MSGVVTKVVVCHDHFLLCILLVLRSIIVALSYIARRSGTTHGSIEAHMRGSVPQSTNWTTGVDPQHQDYHRNKTAECDGEALVMGIAFKCL